jgi:ESCRT-II complex subunit
VRASYGVSTSVMLLRLSFSGTKHLAVLLPLFTLVCGINIRGIGRLKHKDAVEILDSMATEGSIEWDGGSKATAIIYWRKPEEWANAIYEWVPHARRYSRHSG